MIWTNHSWYKTMCWRAHLTWRTDEQNSNSDNFGQDTHPTTVNNCNQRLATSEVDNLTWRHGWNWHQGEHCTYMWHFAQKPIWRWRIEQHSLHEGCEKFSNLMGHHQSWQMFWYIIQKHKNQFWWDVTIHDRRFDISFNFFLQMIHRRRGDRSWRYVITTVCTHVLLIDDLTYYWRVQYLLHDGRDRTW